MSPYRWTLLSIGAISFHPLRDSNGRLISGMHPLWTSGSPSIWEPNVFPRYTDKANLDQYGTLYVAVRAIDQQLVGQEVMVYVFANGEAVAQSGSFKIPNTNALTILVYVFPPAKNPFLDFYNTNFVWKMVLRPSGNVLTVYGPDTTRLELYWIGAKLHTAFRTGIPVAFLQAFFFGGSSIVGGSWYEFCTTRVWQIFNKFYDTQAGASGFNMTLYGGNFSLSYYLAVAPNSNQIGTLSRRVNCFDQGAMVDLVCSLRPWNTYSSDYRPMSWLAQQPFGYIKTTYLVGTVGSGGRFIDVNNPFFGTNQSRAKLSNDDRTRTQFGSHVFVGSGKPFNLTNDVIYDACAGPHTGSETVIQYLSASRQESNETTLYQATSTRPGTVQDTREAVGVTGIDGLSTGTLAAPKAFVRVSDTPTADKLGDMVTRFATASQPLAGTSTMIRHVDWATADAWVPRILGGDWVTQFGFVTASHGTARAFWHLATAGSEPIRVNVIVESAVAQGRIFDVSRSAAAARDRVGEILLSTDRDPEQLWVQGELNEFGDYSIQYGPAIEAGRIVVVAADAVVDITGMSSTAALKPLARRLLHHVVRRDVGQLILPKLQHERVYGRIQGDGAPMVDPPSLDAPATSINTEDIGDNGQMGQSPVFAPQINAEEVPEEIHFPSMFDTDSRAVIVEDISPHAQMINPPTLDAQTSTVSIEGIGTHFTIESEVDCSVAAAGATCDDDHVIFDTCEVESLGGGGGGRGGGRGGGISLSGIFSTGGGVGGASVSEASSTGRGSKVRFHFVTRRLGMHPVHLHVAHGETMVCATRAFDVNVIPATGAPVS